MHPRLNPPLSAEGADAVAAELRQPPANTPERRHTLARAHAAAPFVQRAITSAIRVHR
jgi:hypothetical protein